MNKDYYMERFIATSEAILNEMEIGGEEDLKRAIASYVERKFTGMQAPDLREMHRKFHANTRKIMNVSVRDMLSKMISEDKTLLIIESSKGSSKVVPADIWVDLYFDALESENTQELMDKFINV